MSQADDPGESECPNSKDGHGHCACWWDGDACCWCDVQPRSPEDLVANLLDEEPSQEIPEVLPSSCERCGGDARLLGRLGDQVHYRCRQCGWQFSYYQTVAAMVGELLETCED